MESHPGAFIGLLVAVILSIFTSLFLWANHKTWNIILIIIFVFLGILIGDYFDRQNIEGKKRIFDM